MFFKSKSGEENLSRYSKLIDNLEEAVILYSNSFKVIEFNSAAEKMFGLKRDRVIGKSFEPALANQPEFRLLVQSLFPSLAPAVINKSEPGAYPQVAEINFPESDLYLNISTLPVENKDGEIVFAKIVSDKSESAAVNKAKSEFMRMAAHELRTPITAISWVFETLRDEANVSPEAAAAIRQGLKESQKMSKIVTDLLDVSKIESGKFEYRFENSDIISFIDQVLIKVKEYVEGAGLKIKINFDRGNEKSINVAFDSAKLALAFSKILDNAVKYNIENGDIAVKVEKLQNRPYVLITVADTGIGIPAESMPKLFTKFFKGDNAGQISNGGAGLGLYIAKKIVNAHGGILKVESAVDRGTTVYITLPTDFSGIPSGNPDRV